MKFLFKLLTVYYYRYMLVTNKYCNLNIQCFICFDNLNDFSLDLQIDILSIQFNGVIVIGIVIGNHFQSLWNHSISWVQNFCGLRDFCLFIDR